jgi:hypothetical protein
MSPGHFDTGTSKTGSSDVAPQFGEFLGRSAAISSVYVGAVTLANIAPRKATARQILKSAQEYVLREID